MKSIYIITGTFNRGIKWTFLNCILKSAETKVRVRDSIMYVADMKRDKRERQKERQGDRDRKRLPSHRLDFAPFQRNPP